MIGIGPRIGKQALRGGRRILRPAPRDWRVAASADVRYDGRTVGDGEESLGLHAASDSGRVATYELRSSGGLRIRRLTYFYQETSNGSGGGLRFFDENDQDLLGVATDNPEQEIDDANGFVEVSNGTGYDVWVKVEVIFDWAAETADVRFTSEDGSTSSYPDRPLKSGTPVATVQVWDQTNRNWQSHSIEMWVDAVEIALPG
jgi:hypothetical protein